MGKLSWAELMKGGDLETGTQNTQFLQPGKITFCEPASLYLPKIRRSKNQHHCVVSVDVADSGPRAVELLPRPYTVQKTQLTV